MGFESYTVVLDPCPKLSLRAKQSHDPGNGAVQQIANDLQREWPELRSDDAELRSLLAPLVQGEACLVYETVQGLIQIMLTPCQGQVSLSMRFAYCNPRSVYQPFIAMITWLMKRYQMHAYVMASDNLPDLCDPDEVENILIPSMDYNRYLWQSDAETSQEAILRPADAVRRFILT